MRITLGRWMCIAALVACSQARHDETTGPDSGSGNSCPTCATLTGKVWAPKSAPGDVSPGLEIPVYGAAVYVTPVKPPPIPAHVYCEACGDTPAGAVLSGYDGGFSLSP